MTESEVWAQFAPENAVLTQLRLADTYFKHSVSGLVILDRQFNFIRVNQTYATACRRDIDDFVGHNHFDLYPSDTRLIFEEVVRSKRSFVTFTRAFEFADQPERGVTYWDWTLVPVLDAGGEVEFLVFSLLEVTQRKRDEEALRLASQVYQHSAQAMMVTNGANQIVAVNPAFTGLTGYRAEEVLGRDPSVLRSGRHDAQFYRQMWQQLDGCGHWDGELWDRDRHGRELALHLSINTVYDEHGAPCQRVALFSDITERKRTEQLIWRQANIDALTGAPNRYLFKQRLQQQLALAPAAPLALLLIDLDHFKEINDTLGHDKGDDLLIEAVRRIDACLGGPGMAARLGGDEFAVAVTDGARLAGLDALAGQLVASVAAPYRLGAERAFVSASMGIAHYPADGNTIADLLRHADQAMYAAKGAGRNRYSRFSHALQDAMQQRIGLSNDLHDALAARQLDVHYQPIVELATGRICKAEALLRWQHPQRGPVAPSDFVPLAEAGGMIIEIGDWVFRRAADQVRRIMALDFPAFQIGVNVSPLQFRNDEGLLRRWLDHLAALGLPARSVGIEITEGLLLDVSAELTDTLRGFGAAGTQISLDDFGTGYSSLAYLTRFDIDVLKIDRAFVHRMESEAQDLALCEAIVAMAHKLGLKVVAEGVETQGQRALLAAAGCDYGQGYLFARPMPGAALETWLARSRH
jgi:diguanylate cyclase (GGDEF)-like protein/PAS domain S-box-containing protein